MRARDEADTVQLSKIRMKESLRARIEREAAAKGTTMNGVIVDRLERSFAEDDSLGGPTSASAFRACALIAKSQSAHRGVDWLADPELFDFVLKEWTGLWKRQLRPKAKKGKV
jgi:hypothetical protein